MLINTRILLAATLVSSAFAQVTPAALPPGITPGRAPSYQVAGQLPARITKFAAEPASIQRGGSVVLRWTVEDGQSITIDRGIGIVTPRGSRHLTPAATTTYTLTVTGVGGPLTKTVTVNVAGTTPVPAESAQPAPDKKDVARTADGKPDLSGVYGFSFGGGASGGSAVPVLKPGAEKFKVVRGPTDTGLSSDCMPLGVPGSFNAPYPFQILQAPKFFLIFYEYPNTFRIIPSDGRSHPDDPDPTWMGNSVGHWEGDTMVVDTIGLNTKTEIAGYRHTEAAHVVERFRRIDPGAIQYDVTVEDPNVFASPWVMPSRTFKVRPELEKIDEFVCENNRDYRPLFGKQ
jgi:hypothetical protein